MVAIREEIIQALTVLGPVILQRREEYLEILELKSRNNPKEAEEYLEFLKKAKDSDEIRKDIEDLNLFLAKQKHDYITFTKTSTGKKYEAFRERLDVCIEDYKNAKTAVEETEANNGFDAVFTEIDSLPKKEREMIRGYLRGYGGKFADIIAGKHGMRWHRSVLMRMTVPDSTHLHLSAPNKKFGKPLFDENILKEKTERISEQAFRIVKSYLVSKHSGLSAKLAENEEEVRLVFASNSDEAVKEFVKPYGEEAPSYVRDYAVKAFITESCPATCDEETNRIIFNLSEVSKGRTQTEAETYLLQTAIHEYLHPLGGLEQKDQDLRWAVEGIVERISYDICESKDMKLDWTQSGYAPYMAALKWLNDLGIANNIQETAYFARNPQLLIDEMKKIGMTSYEIGRLLEYGSKIDITDEFQTDMHAFIECVKKIRKRLHNEGTPIDLYGYAMQNGFVYDDQRLANIQDSGELDNYLSELFGGDERVIQKIKIAAELSQKIRGIQKPGPKEIASAVHNKLLVCRSEFHVIPEGNHFLEIFLQKELEYLNGLRFGSHGEKNEPFDFNKSQEIMRKIGIDASRADCSALAEKAIDYLWWKNIHGPTSAQVLDVILESKGLLGHEGISLVKIGYSINARRNSLAIATAEQLRDIHRTRTDQSNLAVYLKSLNRPAGDQVVDAGMKMIDLFANILYPSAFVTVHPEHGVVVSTISGSILDSRVGNYIGGSYHLKMYTNISFRKQMPYSDR